jgi:hypothetical protein
MQNSVRRLKLVSHRVPAYKGIIMQAVAKAWTHYYSKKGKYIICKGLLFVI